MIVRHTDTELCDDVSIFEEKQRYKKWIFNHIPPQTKGGMKDVYDLLKDGNLESYYKLLVHINTPMDCKLNDEHKQQDDDKEDKMNKNGHDKYRKNKKKTKNGGKDMTEMGYLSESKHGILLNVNVKPNAKETCIADNDEQCLYLRIAAQPTDGAANKELCKFIAKLVECNKNEVTIHRGHRSRDKCLLIHNVSLNHVKNKMLNKNTDFIGVVYF